MAPSDASTTVPDEGGIVITVRLIKSFEYRNFKNVILKHIHPESMTAGQLKEMVQQKIRTESGYKPYLKNQFDSLKLYMKAHGAKTSNLIINLDHDEDWFFDDSKTLAELGVEHETEISYFNRAEYDAYKAHPDTKWE
ncbi:hypothetical protein DFJ73DRAFT_850499 [Zopfochytrium polystomum]|nr:hypothetical protein DFJ73DRAFT_850499 [Zopfochytrium polystomum]